MPSPSGFRNTACQITQASRQRFLFRNEPSAVNLLAWILRGLVMGEGKGNSNLFVAVLTYETGCRD